MPPNLSNPKTELVKVKGILNNILPKLSISVLRNISQKSHPRGPCAEKALKTPKLWGLKGILHHILPKLSTISVTGRISSEKNPPRWVQARP